MNCQDVQQVLPEIIDGIHEPEYQAHLKTCPTCSELVSDLELIAREARQLSDTDEPADRVWVKIAAELRAEGIIRESEVAPARPVVVSRARRWNAWWLVPVAAALVVAGSYVIKPKPTAQVAGNTPSAAVAPVEKPQTQSTVARAESDKARTAPQRTIETARQDESANHAPMVTVGTRDLDGVSPEMRPTYEGQLREVDAYIRDAEAYLKQNPDDEDARHHLMNAYQQKAMLYQMALDHVQ